MLIESCFFNVKIMYCKDITIPLKKNNPTSCLLEMSKHVSNFINTNIKIWTELLYRARYYTYYIKLKWRYSALLTWKISNLKKKNLINYASMCLYITGRYFWHLLGWSNRIKDLRFKADHMSISMNTSCL